MQVKHDPSLLASVASRFVANTQTLVRWHATCKL